MLPLPLCAIASLLVLAQAPVTVTARPDDKKPGDAVEGDNCCRPTPRETDPAKLPQDRKSKLLRELATQTTESRTPFVGDGTLHELEARLPRLPANTPPKQMIPFCYSLGTARLDDGNVDGAIQMFERCRALAEAINDREAKLTAMRKLGIAYLRMGERANCARRHNQDSCIFPIKDGGIHADKRGSEKAAEVYLEILRTMEGNDLPSIWLLNIAHMTLGTWPDGVPLLYRIDPRALASERDMPRMYDVAAKKGIKMFARAGGSVVDDFDGDGRLDVVLSSMDVWEPLRLFRQEPDGTFEDVAERVGLKGQIGGLQLIHFDANNDGRLDLLVQRGAWFGASARMPNSLLVQQPDGTFVDRTLEAGIEVTAPSQAAAVADIDNDGDLDIFCGYEAQELANKLEFPCHLWKNRGDGTYEDVTAKAGVSNDLFCKGCAFGDYDNDDFPDLYVSNLFGSPNRLYHNNHDGTFTDVAIPLGVYAPFDSFATWFFDYNNDGNLDIYAANYRSGVRQAEVCAWYRNGTTGTDTQRLYQGDGKGHFTDVTRAVHLDRPCFPMGANFGDIDEDGWPDLYLATGDPDLSSLWPNLMFHNDGGRRFEDVTAATGTGNLQKGHGVSFGDLDGDGDQDLVENLGGAVKDDAFATAVYENPGHGNHWLTVRIVGHQTNRFGHGVRIRANIEEPAGARNVFAFVGCNSSFGGNSLQEEMGLGQAKRIVELEVHWPTTGKTDRFTDVPLDRAIVVEEGAGWREAPAVAQPRR
jgi:hypothetical protein